MDQYTRRNCINELKVNMSITTKSELILQNLPYVDSTKSDKGFTKETVVVGPPSVTRR